METDIVGLGEVLIQEETRALSPEEIKIEAFRRRNIVTDQLRQVILARPNLMVALAEIFRTKNVSEQELQEAIGRISRANFPAKKYRLEQLRPGISRPDERTRYDARIGAATFGPMSVTTVEDPDQLLREFGQKTHRKGSIPISPAVVAIYPFTAETVLGKAELSGLQAAVIEVRYVLVHLHKSVGAKLYIKPIVGGSTARYWNEDTFQRLGIQKQEIADSVRTAWAVMRKRASNPYSGGLPGLGNE